MCAVAAYVCVLPLCVCVQFLCLAMPVAAEWGAGIPSVIRFVALDWGSFVLPAETTILAAIHVVQSSECAQRH